MKVLKTIVALSLVVFGASCGSKQESKLQGEYKHAEQANGLMTITATSIMCQPPIEPSLGLMTTQYVVKSIDGNKITIEVDNPKDTSDPNNPKNTTVTIYLEPDGLSIKDNLILQGHWKRL